LIILAALCVVLAAAAVVIGGPAKLGAGVSEAAALLVSVAPQLALGFLLAGLATVLVPSEAVARLVGDESGVRGLLIATGAGALTPGGPFLQFPLVAALLRSGASEGAVAAYLTAWSLLGMQRVLVWELPVLGPTFATVRWTASLLLPLVVGFAVPYILALVRSE
jgi:uncharacterized membrane protein YraQ (UPF0718 family)